MKSLFLWTVITILVIGLCWSILITIRWKKRARLFEKENQLLQDQQANMEQMMIEVRAERHEFIRHIHAIDHLSRQQESVELDQYIGELTNDLQRLNATLRGEKGHMSSLLAYLMDEGSRHNVLVKYDLEVPLSALPIGLIEQTKLVGNLLENAREAARQYAEKHQKAFVEVSTSMKSGLYLLEIRNSTLSLSGEVLDHLFRRPVPSSKNNSQAPWKHGIGTYVVSETVNTHKGHLDFSYQPPMMSVKVKIPVLRDH